MNFRDFIDILVEYILYSLFVSTIVGVMVLVGLFFYYTINSTDTINNETIEIENVKEYQVDTLYINNSIIIGYNIKYVK